MDDHDADSWQPFRPTPQDLETIAGEVAPVREVQQQLLDRAPDLKQADRVAHQYQIAGSRVILRVAQELPAEIRGVGLFEPGAEHLGVGRLSTGQGCPHVETEPDFLGVMLAFQTKSGRRVDFVAINDPTAPVDDHHKFMDLLHASGESAGAKNVLVEQGRFARSFAARQGALQAAKTLSHIGRQTLHAVLSSTAYQTYWTGILETGSTAAKLSLVPVRDDNHLPGFSPGARHFTEEWAKRQAAGDVEFHLDWIPFLNQRETSTLELTEAWKDQGRARVGTVIFPQTGSVEEAGLWAALASEMGANPGHWVADAADSIPEPAIPFEVARKIAYGISQKGRNALDPSLYQEVFTTGRIGESLAAELKRRRAQKDGEGHVSWAPE